MADRGIIMSGASVRGILAGAKSQTRRILKPQPERFAVDDIGTLCDVGLLHVDGDPWPRVTTGRVVTREEVRFGIGQRLWVREGFALVNRSAVYRTGHEEERGLGPRVDVRWRSPIHMPRWASRLTLTVTDVRVQRLQEISEADVIAEGAYRDAEGVWTMGVGSIWPGTRPDEACHAYKELWAILHGPSAWNENPWVAAISFRADPRNIDADRGRDSDGAAR